MDLLETIIHGFIVGILVSAPMGPIGMLCIQRTLNKGRLSGFVTGLGASLSDLIYALLVGLCMSLIVSFVESYESLLKLIGSLVLLGFGIYIAKKNPAKALSTPGNNKTIKTKIIQDFATGFIFTFSNPLIIFLIIGLFARFNFPSSDFHYYHYICGYLAIIVGAFAWWFVVTYFVNKVRSHFNLRSMWLINIIIGSLISLMSLIGLVMSIIELV